MVATEYQRGINLRPLLIPLILVAVIGTVFGALKTARHAETRHGVTEAARIRECLQQNGPIQEWVNKNDPTVYCFVVDTGREPCSRWSILIAQVWPSILDNCDYRERTAFTPRDGTPSRVVDYLSKTFTRIK